jgi:hypothetical protein
MRALERHLTLICTSNFLEMYLFRGIREKSLDRAPLGPLISWIKSFYATIQGVKRFSPSCLNHCAIVVGAVLPLISAGLNKPSAICTPS